MSTLPPPRVALHLMAAPRLRDERDAARAELIANSAREDAEALRLATLLREHDLAPANAEKSLYVALAEDILPPLLEKLRRVDAIAADYERMSRSYLSVGIADAAHDYQRQADRIRKALA